MTLDEILSDLYLRLHTADEARDLIDGIMWREINAHVAAERDACAQLCDAEADEWDSDEVVTGKNYAAHCAQLIRGRSIS